MNYKNININELGLKQRIKYTASRVALFVPRLLGKLSTKLVINPITKLTTGQTYEQVKEQAVGLTMELQEEKASEMQTQIDEGTANLEAWKNDKYYYETDKAKFKSYKSYVDDLVKKQTKLRQSPKKLLIAKNYLLAMKLFKEKHKEEKETQKMVKQVVAEYLAKKAEIESKKKEIVALEGALNAARSELASMEAELTGFKTENAEIVDQVTEEDYLDAEIEPVVEQPVENDELTEQELNSVVAGVQGVIIPNEETKVEEVAVEPVVEGSQPENSAEEKVTFRSLDPNVNYRIDAEPVHDTIPQKAADAFRQAAFPAAAVDANPEASDLGQVAPTSVDPTLLAQMAQMAAMPQVPASDAQTLESYGLSEEGPQKHL